MTKQTNKLEKEKIFFDLLSKGKEFYYDSTIDTLYSDVNYTLTDGHLGMLMFRHLDEEIFRDTRKIWKEDRTKESRLKSISKLISGRTLAELREASEKSVDDINVPEYLHPILEKLKPTKLVLWSDSPKEVIEAFKDRRLHPIYNKSGEAQTISIYATELDHFHGVLNGKIRFIPTDRFRHDMQVLESAKYRLGKK